MSEPMTANASATGTPKRSRSPTPPPPASTDAPNMETATAFSSPSAPPPAKQAKIGAVEPDATANSTPAASTVAEESSVVASPDTAGADAAASEAQKATGRKAKKPARRWEGKEKPRKTRNDDNSWDNPDRPKSDAPRLPKKKTAVLIGYSGTGCKGLQIQKDPTVKTIEGQLFDAFCKAGAVSADNADDYSKVSLARAARTDAGVHAAGNIVSLKLITAIPGIPDITAHINSFLPPDIRMWGFVRVQNSFNARLACDSRVYEYLLPSHILLPPKPQSALGKNLKRQLDAWNAEEGEKSSPEPYDPSTHPFWKEQSEGQSWEDEQVKRKAWRIDQETLEKAREALLRYEGTHNFHNFTVERSFKDRAASRFMMKMEVREPVVFNGTEWISFRFHGQSFMLHQIRKMMSMVILTTRTRTPTSLIPEAFGPSKLHIPKAPPLGLLLEQPLFESYAKNLEKNTNPDAAKDPINFEQYRTEIDAFKIREIYERLREEEEATNTFSQWIAGVDNNDTSDFDYLNANGTIPASAIKIPGQRPTKKQSDNLQPGAGVESDDEEIDKAALKSGELEG